MAKAAVLFSKVPAAGACLVGDATAGRLTAERMIGTVRVSTDADLDLDPADPANEGKVEVTLTHDVLSNPHKWQLYQGALQAKTEVTLSADKSTIEADGVDTATITITGLAQQAILSLGPGLDLTATVPVGDTVALTADTPQSFEMGFELHLDNRHWATPIRVEAT